MSEVPPLSVGEVLREAMAHITRAPRALLGVALLCGLPDMALDVLDSFMWNSEEAGDLAVGFLVLRSVVTMIFGAIVVGVVTKRVLGLGDVRVRARAPRLMWTSFVYGVRIGVGLLVLVAPGLIQLTKLRLVLALVVAEDASTATAFRRSAELTDGHRAHILLTLAASVLPLFVLQMFLVITYPTWPQMLTSGTGVVIGLLIWGVSALVSVVSAVVDAVLYAKLSRAAPATLDETVQVFA